MRRMLGGIVVGLALSSAALWGEPMIDFSGAGFSGTISSAGLGSSVIGSGVLITSLDGIGVPQNAGNHTVTGTSPTGSGVLNFETGTITSVTYNASQYVYTFNGGGAFSITGNVPDAGINGNQTLLSGTFYDGTFTLTQFGSGYLAMFQGSGADTKNPDLLAYFGLPDTPFRFAGYSIAGSVFGDVGQNGAFYATAMSTDIVNTAAPEPSAILLLGSCLLLIGGLLRRKVNRERALKRAD
ncbi:MAG TPA: hypothetical protein VHA11_15565 [Bryobacteraceae bacterium]|nr:hypothetical protein [Bryobacteraceae bacterium]